MKKKLIVPKDAQCSETVILVPEFHFSGRSGFIDVFDFESSSELGTGDCEQ